MKQWIVLASIVMVMILSACGTTVVEETDKIDMGIEENGQVDEEINHENNKDNQEVNDEGQDSGNVDNTVDELESETQIGETNQDSFDEELDCKAIGYEYDEDNLTYDLVWSDEFDYEGLPDESKWSYDIGGSGWGNRELQYYTEGDNVQVSDGMLTITARKEDYQANEYTSTRLITKNKGDWLYGRIEVRAKLPSGTGTWPAIWMLPTKWVYGGWPRSGEIDIMEHVGYEEGKIHGTVHTSAYNHMEGTQIGKSVIREDATQVFYTYSIEWMPDKIKFYIDDKLYFIFKPGNLVNCPTEDQWPFDQEFHLLLNIAVGGSWGGAKGVDEEIFPQEMVIDYVRVYQAQEFEQYQTVDE